MSKLRHVSRAPIEDQSEDEIAWLNKKLAEKDDEISRLFNGLREARVNARLLLGHIEGLLNGK